MHNLPFPQPLSSEAILCTPICLAANKPTGRGGGKFAPHSVSSASPLLRLPTPPTFRDNQRPVGPSSSSRVHFLGKTLFLWPLGLNWLRFLLSTPTSPKHRLPSSSLALPGCPDVFPETAWHFWLLSTLSQISVGLRRGSRVIIKAKGRQALTAFHSPLPRASIFPLH